MKISVITIKSSDLKDNNSNYHPKEHKEAVLWDTFKFSFWKKDLRNLMKKTGFYTSHPVSWEAQIGDVLSKYSKFGMTDKWSLPNAAKAMSNALTMQENLRRDMVRWIFEGKQPLK